MATDAKADEATFVLCSSVAAYAYDNELEVTDAQKAGLSALVLKYLIPLNKTPIPSGVMMASKGALRSLTHDLFKEKFMPASKSHSMNQNGTTS